MKMNVKQTLQRAKAYELEGYKDTARHLYLTVLKIHPGNKHAKRALNRLQTSKPTRMGIQNPTQDELNAVINLYNNAKFTEAAQKSTCLIKKYPSSPVAWNIFGAASKELGHLEQAVNAFTKVTQLDPKFRDAYSNLGVALWGLGNLNDAIGAFRNAIRLKPDSVSAYGNLSSLFVENKHLATALKINKLAIKNNPKSASVYFDLSITLRYQGRLNDAISALKRAIHIEPSNPTYFRAMGVCYKLKGEIQYAAKFFSETISLCKKYRNSKDFSTARLPDISRSLIDQEAMKAASGLLDMPVSLLNNEMVNLVEEYFNPRQLESYSDAKHLYIRAHLLRHKRKLREAADIFHVANLATKVELGIETPRKSHTELENIRNIQYIQKTNKTNQLGRLNLFLILGPSRSGKSTLEKLLSQSKNVIPRYEAMNAKAVSAIHSESKTAEYNISQEEIFRRIFYIENLSVTDVPKIITCTNPEAFRYFHLLSKIIDNMHIIYVERCDKEIIVDMYLKLYSPGIKYAYDLESIKEYLSEYRAAMAALESRLGALFIKIQRRHLLSNPKHELQKISSLTGLNIDVGHELDYSLTEDNYYEYMYSYLFEPSGKNPNLATS